MGGTRTGFNHESAPITVPTVCNSRSKIEKRERIECICGSVSDDDGYEGLWLQCDSCDAWLHGACVGHPVRAPAGT